MDLKRKIFSHSMIQELHNQLFSIFFERDISKKALSLIKLLENNTSEELLIAIHSINYNDLDQLIRYLDVKTKLLTIMNYCDQSSKSISSKALVLLEKNIEEVARIDSIEDKVKVLKYIANHASKSISKRAIEMLKSLLGELDRVNNLEFVASTLRYVYVSDDDPQLREIILKKIDKLEDEKIKMTSLDYLQTLKKHSVF